ncbi:MAG: CBS domain-containing protein [Fervidicoccaceae archaeon]
MSNPRRFEKHRWLRSDGKPEFSSRVYRVEGDLERLAKRTIVTISPTSPVREAIERMNNHKVRSLLITVGNKFDGLLLAENIIDYLGGGELYNIAINKYEGNFYKCIEEPIESIVSDKNIYVYTNTKISEVIEKMVNDGVSILPVLNKDGTVYGIISEHDIVELLAEKRTGVSVGDIASQIISINTFEPLQEAMKKIISLGVRQIFLRNEVEQIVGAINIKGIIRYFATSEVYKWVKKGYITEANSIPVGNLASYGILRIPDSLDVGEAAREMVKAGFSSALVVKDSEDFGMVTERDIFYSLAFPIK